MLYVIASFIPFSFSRIVLYTPIAHCSPAMFCFSISFVVGLLGSSYPQLLSLLKSFGFRIGSPPSSMILFASMSACSISSFACSFSSSSISGLIGPFTTYEPAQYWYTASHSSASALFKSPINSFTSPFIISMALSPIFLSPSYLLMDFVL